MSDEVRSVDGGSDTLVTGESLHSRLLAPKTSATPVTMPNGRRVGKRRTKPRMQTSDTMLGRANGLYADDDHPTTRLPYMPDAATTARPTSAPSQNQKQAAARRYVSRLTRNTLAIIMAGGRGERLKHLTDFRCKPATPFGGKFRIIDFVLSNCVNSGIRRISVLTQYKAHSLIQHIQRGWGYLRGEFGEFVEIVPAQQQRGPDWYRGTADSLWQNMDMIRHHRPLHVLVLAGDHIYKMDYGPMIGYHVEKEADITVGVVEVPRVRAREFGVMTVEEGNRVVR